MKNGPWCHVTICNQLSVCSFEDYFTTGFKDRFKLMYDVDAYEIMYPSGIETAISVGDRPLKNTSSTDKLESIGHKINFINNWLQYFSGNVSDKTGLYKQNMMKTPLSLPIKS